MGSTPQRNLKSGLPAFLALCAPGPTSDAPFSIIKLAETGVGAGYGDTIPHCARTVPYWIQWSRRQTHTDKTGRRLDPRT